MVQSTIVGSTQVLQLNEPTIPLNFFDNFELTVLGHVHKHQGLKRKPPVVYCGSIDRITFAETEEQKGFVIYDTETKDLKFVELNVRDFVHLQYKWEEGIENTLKCNNKDAVTRITFDIARENIPKVDDTKIIDEFKKCFYFDGIHYNILSEKRTRSSEVNETLSPLDALKEYLKTVKLEQEKKERVFQLGKKVLLEVEKS